MTVKSQPYYWLVCDEPGCGERAPDAEHDEFTAMHDASTAADIARDRSWTISPTDDGPDYCDDHRKPQCYDCERIITQQQHDEQDGICPACLARDEAAGQPEPADAHADTPEEDTRG